MKKLTKTAFLELLCDMESISTPTEMELQPMYDDFAESVTSLCYSLKGMGYFTLHYTRLELERFQSHLSSEGKEKKCIHPPVYHPVLVLH